MAGKLWREKKKEINKFTFLTFFVFTVYVRLIITYVSICVCSVVVCMCAL